MTSNHLLHLESLLLLQQRLLCAVPLLQVRERIWAAKFGAALAKARAAGPKECGVPTPELTNIFLMVLLHRETLVLLRVLLEKEGLLCLVLECELRRNGLLRTCGGEVLRKTCVTFPRCHGSGGRSGDGVEVKELGYRNKRWHTMRRLPVGLLVALVRLRTHAGHLV